MDRSLMDIPSHFNLLESIIRSTPPAQLEYCIRNRETISSIAGVDEAGRGPLAGPVVACACILPNGYSLPGLTDSKKCTPKKREMLYEILTTDTALSYTVAIVSHEEIDAINILQATLSAMSQALSLLVSTPSVVLVDGNKKPKYDRAPLFPIVKGDQYISAISAASIIAKVIRDRIMDSYNEIWPHFCFGLHKGYGTKLHFELLEKYGPLPIHRKSFEPIKSMYAKKI